MKCVNCDRELNGKQKLYCSRVCHNKMANVKLQSYTAQQERGLIRKKELVKLLGGSCKCGYNKNLAALEFHHIDPTTKSFNLDLRKLSNSSLEDCLKEVKKCKLLCANCHREEHHPNH